MKIKLKSILITVGIISWLTIIFFVYSSEYSAEAKRFSFYSSKNYEDPDSIFFTQVKSKLTLILLNDDMVFGYYGDSMDSGKVVSINEADKLIQDAWKISSKDSLIVFIKPTVWSINSLGDLLDKMSANQIENHYVCRPNKAEKEFIKLPDRIKVIKEEQVYWSP